jgi:transcriptional regulator with XRE-family HTH domain
MTTTLRVSSQTMIDEAEMTDINKTTDHTEEGEEHDAPVSLGDFLTELGEEDEDFAEALAEAAPLQLLANIVGDLRSMRGLTQKELAERIGKQQPAIARIENASVNTGWETIAEILHALRVHMHFAPAEAHVMMISRDEFDARIRSAEQRGFADGMAQAASMQGVRHANFDSVEVKGSSVVEKDKETNADASDLAPA